MNYKTIFAIENGLKDSVGNDSNGYMLKNYDHLGEKLISDFYLKYFIREILFEIDVLEVKDYIDYHFSNSSRPSSFIDLLRLKVVPKIDYILQYMEPDLDGCSYSEWKQPEDGFVENDVEIFKPIFEDATLLHYAYTVRAGSDLKLRKEIIEEYLNEIQLVGKNTSEGGLKWKGKPSHLAIIIKKFVNEGYIEAPRDRGGDINISALARSIKRSFVSDEELSINTLMNYLSEMEEKNKGLMKKFENEGFNIPNSKWMG